MPDVRLRDAFDTADRKRAYVRELFATIADRYDLITILLSFGRDRHWKNRLLSLAGIRPGAAALDVACGTGDITLALARRGARTVGLDVTLRMVQIAAAKPSPGAARFVVGDMMSLPFAGGQFDVITSGYGIRNVPSIEPALLEISRTLKPGGVFLSLDFNRPSSRAVRLIYLGYLSLVGSVLGLVLHRDPDTYRYIPESIRRYPGAERVCGLACANGFSSCEWHRVLGGLMAIHVAKK
jgi:demethylmenaquinone methyltransferase/2-methoxy-6-polyprenyl-1,4-benzoquinol methylase